MGVKEAAQTNEWSTQIRAGDDRLPGRGRREVTKLARLGARLSSGARLARQDYQSLAETFQISDQAGPALKRIVSGQHLPLLCYRFIMEPAV